MMNNTYQFKSIEKKDDIRQCEEVIFLLRPHLDKENWASMIAEMMQHEQYSIAGMTDNGKVIAFAGYRIMTSLHSGHVIYIDDLCTLELYRGQGLASLLLQHIKGIAKGKNKDAVLLDTNFNNHTAQKLYLGNGFQMAALHLACPIAK